MVPFHYVGIVKEFPTAGQGTGFFVANSAYVRGPALAARRSASTWSAPTAPLRRWSPAASAPALGTTAAVTDNPDYQAGHRLHPDRG